MTTFRAKPSQGCYLGDRIGAEQAKQLVEHELFQALREKGAAVEAYGSPGERRRNQPITVIARFAPCSTHFSTRVLDPDDPSSIKPVDLPLGAQL